MGIEREGSPSGSGQGSWDFLRLRNVDYVPEPKDGAVTLYSDEDGALQLLQDDESRSPLGGPGGIQATSVILESDDILALHSTPVTIVPAPGSGFIVVPMLVTTDFKYGTTPYTDSDGYVAVRYEGVDGDDIAHLLTVGRSSDFVRFFWDRPLIQDYSSQQREDVEDTAVQILSPTENPTDGDGRLKVTTWYATIALLT